LGVNVGIQNPRSGSDGTLQFDYNGPRILLALVIGNVDAGRAFIQEMVVRSDEFSNIRNISDLRDYRGGTVLLPPIEVFPSVIPPQTYKKCSQQTDDRGRVIGDLINCDAVEANQFVLNCRPKPSTAPIRLTTEESPHFLPLRLLAPV